MRTIIVLEERQDDTLVVPGIFAGSKFDADAITWMGKFDGSHDYLGFRQNQTSTLIMNREDNGPGSRRTCVITIRRLLVLIRSSVR